MSEPDELSIPCDQPGCDYIATGPEGGRGNVSWRLNSHKARGHGITPDGIPRPPRDTPPPREAPKIDLNLGFAAKPKADPALEAVRQRAEQFASVAAVVLLLAGQELDAADIERGKGQWATAVADLAKHEEWLRKLCEDGEASERVVAWIKFAAATLGLTLPILLRHGALPPMIAKALAMAAQAPVPDAPADRPDLQPVA